MGWGTAFARTREKFDLFYVVSKDTTRNWYVEIIRKEIIAQERKTSLIIIFVQKQHNLILESHRIIGPSNLESPCTFWIPYRSETVNKTANNSCLQHD